MISGTRVCDAMKARLPHRPNARKSRYPTRARNTPFSAALRTRGRSPSPNARDKSAFTPTAVPLATPIIRFCAGNASDTAVSACSLIRLTNTLSTTL